MSERGRLRGLAGACWNFGMGISNGCFIFDFDSLSLEVARPIQPTLCTNVPVKHQSSSMSERERGVVCTRIQVLDIIYLDSNIGVGVSHCTPLPLVVARPICHIVCIKVAVIPQTPYKPSFEFPLRVFNDILRSLIHEQRQCYNQTYYIQTDKIAAVTKTWTIVTNALCVCVCVCVTNLDSGYTVDWITRGFSKSIF